MKVEQNQWTTQNGWRTTAQLNDSAHLVLMFGSGSIITDSSIMNQVTAMYPKAIRIGCSTAGEIFNTQVNDETLSLTAVHFEHSTLKITSKNIANPEDSYLVGKQIQKDLLAPNLKHIFILAEGLNINGSKLVDGITDKLPESVTVTGGLAGDGSRFLQTFVYLNEHPNLNEIVAIGIYGDRIKITSGSKGGLDTYGVVRRVTKSDNNVLYELDHQPALDYYKLYLGEKARDLPASGLLFPLNLKRTPEQAPVVRTVLGVDEVTKSMTFAGDIPTGGIVQFMKANFNRLVDAAASAAKDCTDSLAEIGKPDLVILISCVGRKIILKQRVEEEVEAIRDTLGSDVPITGFYSYGEIAPVLATGKCELHNQTMTITAFKEF